jgi:serine/threonine-protein kinase
VGVRVFGIDAYARPVTPSGPNEYQPGDRIGPYVLEEPLGEGGMGIVFRAVRLSDATVVALKLLRPELTQDDTFRRRFEHEARAAGEVAHRHLVSILDVGQANGDLYLATSFVDGSTLEHRLGDRGALELDELVRLISQVGAGLDALHRAGVVHRDVKPANIMIDADAAAVLTDFGIARGYAYTVLTRTGMIVGTLGYIAPELLRGEGATPATDIYSLGCVAYECLSGRPPFADRSLLELANAHVNEQPTDPAVDRDDAPEGLSWVILTALSKDAEERPPTAAAFANMLMSSARTLGTS